MINATMGIKILKTEHASFLLQKVRPSTTKQTNAMTLFVTIRKMNSLRNCMIELSLGAIRPRAERSNNVSLPPAFSSWLIPRPCRSI